MTQRALIPLPDHPYYLWQALAQCVNLPEHGVEPIFLVYGPDLENPVPSALLEACIEATQGVATWHFWPDSRQGNAREYDPAMKPRLMGFFFERFPERVRERFLYLDPDVLVIREPSGGWDSLPPGAASDTDSYTGPGYLDGKRVLDWLALTCSADADAFRQIRGAGAQYLVQGISSMTWHSIASLSERAYREMTRNAHVYRAPGDTYAVQAWCAEMYVTQLVSLREGRPFLPDPRMAFIWTNAPVSAWDDAGTTFYHNAGVVGENGVDFCKISHQVAPWDDEGKLLDAVRATSPSSASSRYVDVLEETTRRFPDLTSRWRQLNDQPHPNPVAWGHRA